MTFEAFSSPEGRHRQREQRIHVCPGPANAVAVHAVFDGLGYVVSEGSLTRSMTAARKLVHQIMEEYDSQSSYLQHHATLTPITAERACAACNTGGRQELCRTLWSRALHDLDHMTRVRTLIELADMAQGVGH